MTKRTFTISDKTNVLVLIVKISTRSVNINKEIEMKIKSFKFPRDSVTKKNNSSCYPEYCNGVINNKTSPTSEYILENLGIVLLNMRSYKKEIKNE